MIRRGLFLVALSLPAIAACGRSESAPPSFDEPVSRATDEDPIAPLPRERPAAEARRVALGEKLFFDPKLSGDSATACATCHLFNKGGADGRAYSQLAGRDAPTYNTPSIFNRAFDYRLNWQSKYESLEEQFDSPLMNPRVMGTSWDEVLGKIRADGDYTVAFRAIYGDVATQSSVRDAVSTYERTLTTPGSRFDRFLDGDPGAINDEERTGYAMFKSYGCISCHQGINVGGNLVARFGVMRDFADRGPVHEADLGRYLFTKRESDRFVFRVPSLRNVELTAPYFHDGSMPTLEEAVIEMGEYQLGRSLSTAQADSIAAFLRSLTGTAPAPKHEG